MPAFIKIKLYRYALMVTIGMFTVIMNANAATQTNSTTSISLENCHLKGIHTQVKCGKLSVPENYKIKDGANISLNIAVLPAIDNSENKTAFMFLAGGPGQAAVELAAPLWTALNDIRKTRDIILIDQRGTGKSNPLTCDEAQGKNVYQLTQKEFTTDEVKKCIAEFKVTDLAQYNSENAIRDFDAVRAALGYKQINLYGGSYGTRAALVYMRMFPENIRSVVLDGVGPIEVPIGLFGKSAAHSFELLTEHCKQDQACNEAYPNLVDEFNQLKIRLDKSPVEIEIPHPRLGTKTKFVIDNDKLISNLRMQLYSVEMRTLVPLVIHQAYLENYMPLAGLIAQTDGGTVMYIGLTFNIVCNEDIPRITPEMFANDADNSFGGNNSHLAWNTACSVWPKYQPSAEFSQSVTANIPTLILSGELDPVTPPSNGEYPAKSLPNSRHIVIKNSSHTSLGTCAPKIINEFLTTLKVNELDESCLDELPPESFMTDLNG